MIQGSIIVRADVPVLCSECYIHRIDCRDDMEVNPRLDVQLRERGARQKMHPLMTDRMIPEAGPSVRLAGR